MALGAPRRERQALSIQSRIAAAAVGAAIGVLLAASGVFFLVQWGENAADLQRGQQALARVSAAQVGHALEGGRRPDFAIDSLAPVVGLKHAAYVDASGRTVVSFGAAPALRGGETKLAEARAPVIVGGRTVGMVVMASAPDRLADIASHYLAVCGALFFAATGIALFIGRALAKRVVEPIQRLAEVMGGVTAAEHFSVRARRYARDEVGALTDGFNDLLGRLEVNDASLRTTLGALTAARDAAEAANVMKSQFLANMSHEIRTPLNGVLAMTQVIAMDDLSAVQRGRLNVVHDSGQALLAILNDVLDVSKIEAGKLDLESADIDAAAIVRSACEAFGAVTVQKGLAFSVEVAPDAEGLRRGDGVRLRQVVVNLVSNAVKFTSAGSVKVRLEAAGDGLRLHVQDSGVGIAEDLMPALFDNFTQGDSSTTRKFGGTGLGLAICRQLVTLMDGRIDVNSHAGRGSHFIVHLPLPSADTGARAVTMQPTAPPPPTPKPPSAIAAAPAAASASPDVSAADVQAEHAPLRVLAAEDNATNRLVLSTVMGVFGVELEMVEDGEQAVAAWERGAFDVVLMDIQMPVMDGIEATRAIRVAEAAHGRPRTPIVALSANAMTHQVRDYLAAGMDAHVSKPIELARLQAVLESVLDARAQAAA